MEKEEKKNRKMRLHLLWICVAVKRQKRGSEKEGGREMGRVEDVAKFLMKGD